MQETRPFPRLLAIVPGFVIGILWIALAAAALYSAARGYAHDRSDWGLGWGIVGVFLLAGGIAALVGTWWHNFRVVSRSHH
jgi:tryptophan-rich sensory protein